MSMPRDAWRALGPATRLAVWKNAVTARAHPDPVVSAVAARYARQFLDARPLIPPAWPMWAGLLLADLLVAGAAAFFLSPGPDLPAIGPGVPAAGPGGFTAGEVTAILWVAAAIFCVIIALYAFRQLRIIAAWRLEWANERTLRTVAAAGHAEVPPLAGGWAAAAGQRLSVRYDRTRLLASSFIAAVAESRMLVTVTGQFLSGSGITPSGWLCGFLAVPGLFLVALCARPLVRWALPGRPVLELDAAGVRMPGIAVDLPWTSLAEIRLIPVRYFRRGSHGPAALVAFMPRDPSAVLAAVPGGSWRRRRLERLLRVYGTPLTFHDLLADHSGEQIAAVIAALGTVPVRRA